MRSADSAENTSDECKPSIGRLKRNAKASKSGRFYDFDENSPNVRAREDP